MHSTAQPFADAQRPVPLAVAALGAVLLIVLCAVLVARLTGFEPAQPQLGALVESRLLGFRDLPRGRIEVYDWESAEVITSIDAGEGSFLRGVMRSLVRQRRGAAIDANAPFRLDRYADGRLIIRDPETGEDIDLIAFGPSNIAAFAALLPPASDETAVAQP